MKPALRLVILISSSSIGGVLSGCHKTPREEAGAGGNASGPHITMENVLAINHVVPPRTASFNDHCRGIGQDRPNAAGGAAIKPNRPPHLWITGCSTSSKEGAGYFHAIIDHAPEPGKASSSLFLLTMPGHTAAPVEIKNAEFEITEVTHEHLAGKFELRIPVGVGEGAANETWVGNFDVPRLPDDTSRGP